MARWKVGSRRQTPTRMDLRLLAKIGAHAPFYPGGVLLPKAANLYWLLCVACHSDNLPVLCKVSELNWRTSCVNLRFPDSTIQFGGISAFHTRISDPVVGGTYMTVS